MANATTTVTDFDSSADSGSIAGISDQSIVSSEAAHFGAMAEDWWNPKGSSAMLHRLNPVRLAYIRESIDCHWSGDPKSRRPLGGKRALDMGCGAGLLTEPLARLGAEMTGIDAAPENIAAAKAHALQSRLTIDYRAGGADAIEGGSFDLITCMEVIEHVSDPAAFVADLADALAPGGLLIMSTPNRTPLSRLTIITLAEGLGRIPRGTHDWDKFLTPDELSAVMKGAGLTTVDTRGIGFRIGSGFTLTDDLKLDYLITAKRI
ncbi:bifunctional 3-demethylubiquinone 3-O-methyltransferase/2-octaprenyl-6-hydroxy phenol methylase [soil metagenome]